MKDNKKAIFINTASQVLVRFVTLAIALISIKLLSRYLGPAGVGDYNTITTYINLFIVVADLGLFSVAVREISKNPEREKKILSNVFNIRLVSAVIATCISIVVVFFTHYSSDIKLGTIIASGFILFNLMASLYDMVLQYRLKMQFSALAELLSKVLSIIALYIIVAMHGNFLWIISTVTFSGVTIFVFKWLFARRYIKIASEYDHKVAKWIFHMSWPIGLVFIINNLYFKLDTLMLFAIKGATAVGIYSVAYKVLEVTVFVGSYFASALKPTISENIAKEKIYMQRLIEKSINIMLLLSLPLAFVSLTFSKEIILFLSTPDFLSGSRALIFLSLTLPVIYLDTLLGEILIANDERKLLIRVAIFILLFNFLANLYFIPRYSFMGAAVTTLLSELLLLGINLHYTRKIVKFGFDFRTVTKGLAISIFCLFIAFFLKTTGLYFLVSIVLVLGLYIFLLTIFNIISPAYLRQMMSKSEAVEPPTA